MTIERWKNELNALVNRGMDRHLRLAVTGLSRSGKTAFITAMVNQLLNVHAGARLPLLSAVREERLLGVKRVPSVILVFRVLPMMKGWRSSMARLPSGQRLHAVSVRFASRCVSARRILCCAILKRPPRCIWKLSIILVNGCWICRCWLRII
jgi:hypothetical protein